MRRRWRHAGPEIAALLLTALAAGCGSGRWPAMTSSQRVIQRLDHADDLARVGRYLDARDGYVSVLAEAGAPAEMDRALLGLARLTLMPENPGKDEQTAAMYLDRLVREYPDSHWTAEARIWRELLRNLERLQRDIQRQQHELQRLRRVQQHEQQEVVRLRKERERLREIDLELERPTKGMTPTSPQTGPIPRE